MARAEHTVVVQRTPEDVFDYLTNVSNATEWQSGTLDVQAPGEAMAVGTRFVQVLKFLGKRIETTLEVTEYESGRRFSIKTVSGPIPFDVHHTLEPSDGGTKLHVVLEGEPGGFFKLAEPLVVRNAQRQIETDLATLKDILETR